MTSNKDDHNDLGMDMDMENMDDIIDVEDIDEPLSAHPLGGSDYDSDSGEDDYAEGPESEPHGKKKKSGGMVKIVAPVLVLLAAAGAGGYIVMNPSVMGGAPQMQEGSLPATPVLPSSTEAAAISPPPVAPEEPVQELAAPDVPPQPLANLNEAPGTVVENVPAPASAPDLVVADVSADAPEEAGMQHATQPATEQAVSVQEEIVSTGAESNVPVAPESAAIQNLSSPAGEGEVAPIQTSPAVTAEGDPEVMPETVAQAPAETVPVAAGGPTAAVAPEAVTEPTFVPAAPAEEAAVTEPPPVVAADAAVPPVMNVGEVPGASMPQIPLAPTTESAPPSPGSMASGGQASAPLAPLPDGDASNVYYDSLSQVPTGSMATSIGPREVNPVFEPASKMVIVHKDKGEGSQESLLVSANRALKLKRYDAALEMFDQLYAKNNRDVRILMGRAVAQQNMGLSESAIQSYEEVLKLKPNHTEALINMMGLVRTQYPEVALRRLLELYSQYPNNAGIAAQIGVTNAELGHFDDAMRYLGIASTLEPNNAQHLFNMAIAADRKGERAQAVNFYERALEVDVMYGSSRSIPRERIYDRLSVLRRG